MGTFRAIESRRKQGAPELDLMRRGQRRLCVADLCDKAVDPIGSLRRQRRFVAPIDVGENRGLRIARADENDAASLALGQIRNDLSSRSSQWSDVSAERNRICECLVVHRATAVCLVNFEDEMDSQPAGALVSRPSHPREPQQPRTRQRLRPTRRAPAPSSALPSHARPRGSSTPDAHPVPSPDRQPSAGRSGRPLTTPPASSINSSPPNAGPVPPTPSSLARSIHEAHRRD